MSAYRVRRPTEDVAVMVASRSPRRAPSLPSLFEALQTAHAVRDRHMIRLVQHAIARAVGRVEAAR